MTLLDSDSTEQKEYVQSILLVDDDMFIRSLTKKMVGPFVTVDTISESNQVLSAYKEGNHALVILDIHMPNRSGLNLLADILAYDPQACVVMASADSTKNNVIESKARGARSFITKPFHQHKLLKILKDCPHIKSHQLNF